jgi:hypothetical protein
MKPLLIILLFCSCAVRPQVKQFTVTKVYDGYFQAKSGRRVLYLATQDSVYIGRIINVSVSQ